MGRLERFPADVGEVSLAERPSLMRALGLRQGRRGPTIFPGTSPEKIVAPIAASRPLTRSLTQPVTHIFRNP